MTTDPPVLEVLHVADRPTYPDALALVERVRAGLGIAPSCAPS